MKKAILLICLVSSLFLIGCNFGGTYEPKKEIKFFVEDGGGVMANSIIQKNVEIYPGMTQFLHQFIGQQLAAVYYVDEVPQTVQLDLSEDYSNAGENHCFRLEAIRPYETGYGTTGDLWWDGPGKSRFKAVYEETVSEITVFCFDSVDQHLDGWNGIKILSQFERTGAAVTKEECFIYKVIPEFVLPGKSYMITTELAGDTYLEKLYNIRSVDFDKLNAGITDRVVNTLERFYVCENPGPAGGYVKISVQPNWSYIWDWSLDGNFRE